MIVNKENVDKVYDPKEVLKKIHQFKREPWDVLPCCKKPFLFTWYLDVASNVDK